MTKATRRALEDVVAILRDAGWIPPAPTAEGRDRPARAETLEGREIDALQMLIARELGAEDAVVGTGLAQPEVRMRLASVAYKLARAREAGVEVGSTGSFAAHP